MTRMRIIPLVVLLAACGSSQDPIARVIPPPPTQPVPVVAAAPAPAPPAAPAPAPARQLAFDRANLDTSVNACTDFYQYANGGWLKANPIPPAYASWGMASQAQEDNRRILREVLEAAAAKPAAQRTPNEQKIGDFWSSCMDEKRNDAAGITPIQPELDRIDNMSSPADLQREMTRLQSLTVNAPFILYSNQDAKNSSEVIAEIGQAGLGLPERDYYFRDDEKSKTIRDEYRKHLQNLFHLAGDDVATSATKADAVIKLETALAKASMTRVQQRDPNAVYHRMTVAQLAAIVPNIDWNAYFAERGVSIKDLNVSVPDFMKEVSARMKETPLADWKAYLRAHLLMETAAGLTTAFREENFHFRGQVLQGQKTNQPLWRRCVVSADSLMGEALGQAYVDRKFSPDAKRRATELVANLVDALHNDITTLGWMSDATRQQALTKLSAFKRKIGYPDQWRDYSALTIANGPYVNNYLAANAFEARRDLAKIGKPVDRLEWGMTPPTYNAYYNPALNEIVFPAGILQWPMFDPEQDDAFNYGSIGSVIGHEMTHGFDDQGSQYDAQGNLRNWWTAEDKKKFDARAQCIVAQFDAFEVEPGLHQKGQLVAGESIADLGGLTIAWAAWQHSLQGKPKPPVIDGFTPEQRFFLGFARARASNITPEAARMRVQIDPHPLNRFRVNGPLSNTPEFATAFQCKAGDAMVREKRCDIW